MQDYVTPLTFGVLLASHVAVLAALGTSVMSPPSVFPGWRVVSPGGTHYFCLFGAWGFGALISWVWLFVGSARSDAIFQMRVAFLLAIVFTFSAAGTGFYIAAMRRTALRWRGAEIRWREGGRERRQTFSEFAAIRRALDGRFHIRFADHTILKLDHYARNAEAFLVRLSEEIGEDVY